MVLMTKHLIVFLMVIITILVHSQTISKERRRPNCNDSNVFCFGSLNNVSSNGTNNCWITNNCNVEVSAVANGDRINWTLTHKILPQTTAPQWYAVFTIANSMTAELTLYGSSGSRAVVYCSTKKNGITESRDACTLGGSENFNGEYISNKYLTTSKIKYADGYIFDVANEPSFLTLLYGSGVRLILYESYKSKNATNLFKNQSKNGNETDQKGNETISKDDGKNDTITSTTLGKNRSRNKSKSINLGSKIGIVIGAIALIIIIFLIICCCCCRKKYGKTNGIGRAKSTSSVQSTQSTSSNKTMSQESTPSMKTTDSHTISPKMRTLRTSSESQRNRSMERSSRESSKSSGSKRTKIGSITSHKSK